MSRARNIKPGFFTNEDLVSLPFATRLLFAGLWTMADRAGRLEDRPKKIKIEIFPCDDVNIEEMLDQLAGKAFILRYSVFGVSYITIQKWEKHQNPHPKEKPSEIPAPIASVKKSVSSKDSECSEEPFNYTASNLEAAELKGQPGLTSFPSGSSGSSGSSAIEPELSRKPPAPFRVPIPPQTVKPPPGYESFSFPKWFEDRWQKHPNPKFRQLAQQYAGERIFKPSPEGFFPEAFDSAHDAWCASEEWAWQHGAKAPTMADFIVDLWFNKKPQSAKARDSPKPKPNRYKDPTEHPRERPDDLEFQV